jgi:nitrate reductase NapE component
MSTNTSVSPKVFPTRRVLVTGLMIILAIAVTTGFVWMHTDHIIAPPGLRLMDELWTLFICRCPPL